MNHSTNSLSTSIDPLGRLRSISRPSGAFTFREILVLAIAGVVATSFVAFLPTPIRVPGHAIFKAALPIVCGVALLPRAWAGTMSGIAASLTAAVFMLLGIGHLPAASLTSLLAIGPAVDLAFRGTKVDGARLYARLAVAGLAANLCAFAVRWGTVLLQMNTLHPLNFKQMAMGALFSFAACGLAAGLISAMICFRHSPRSETEP